MVGDDEDPRETEVVRLLHVAIGLVVMLGVLAIVAGGVDQLTGSNRVHVEPAVPGVQLLSIVLLLLPAGWVYRRPRWPQIVVWIMWASSWLMLGFILQVDTDRGSWLGMDSFWIYVVTRVCTIAIGFTVIVAVPLIRASHKSPRLPPKPKLPKARVVR